MNHPTAPSAILQAQSTVQTPSQQIESAMVSDMEAARILGQARRTLAVWRCTGRYNLPYVRIGRKIFYRVSDLEAFIKRRVHHGHPDAAGVQA
ncbi:MAG: helix-turn-helix domain-containing protein [Methylococcaceae bacterium]|nr:helix-turn-helix domain-containing protein [Methylococcaceae bacterium]